VLWLELISHPAEGRSLSWPWWIICLKYYTANVCTYLVQTGQGHGRQAHSNFSREGGTGYTGHGERGAPAYNGGLGAEPPAGSMGKAPSQGVRGRSGAHSGVQG